jgi:thioredoxin-related protein
MKILLTVLRPSPYVAALMGILLFAVSNPAGAAGDETKMVYPGWFKHSFYELPADLAEARQAGKQGILLFFHTPTCSYCQALLSKTFAHQQVAKRLSARFDVVALDVISDVQVTGPDGNDYWAKDFAVHEHATFTPTLVFYSGDGERMLRLVGYTPPDKMLAVLEYLQDDQYKKQTLRAYLARRAQPSATAVEFSAADDPLFSQPPYILDRRAGASDRPLLVLFERRRCESCARFRRIALDAPKVRALLERFEVVRLDMDDPAAALMTPAGDKTTAGKWADNLRLTHAPALVFFDGGGREVLRVDSELLIDARGEAVTDRDPEFVGNVAARLEYVLNKSYQKHPQFQQWRKWRAQQKNRKGGEI